MRRSIRAVAGAPAWTLALALAGSAMAARAPAQETHLLGEGVQLACSQPETYRLTCDFRLFIGGDSHQLTASLDDRALPLPQVTPHGSEPGVTAVLFLVDVSGAAREAAVEGAGRDIASLLASAWPHQRFGLASFASEMRVHVPLGAPADAVEEAVADLRAGGHTSEFYRNMLEAVRLLVDYPARRRALVVFSHGLADDRAYFHKDVVDAARAGNVAIFAVGHAMSPTLTAALQRLRRLSEETGGAYEARDADAGLSEAFVTRVWERLDSGGRLFVDLAPQGDRLARAGSGVVTLHWQSAEGSATARVPVRVGALPGAGDGSRLVSTPPEVSQAAAARDRPPPVPPVRRPGWLAERFLWLALIAGLGLLAGLAFWILRRRQEALRPKEPPWAETLELNARNFAYVEVQDGRGTRHPVSGEVFRIGRQADNELMLVDPSISRHHAEIKHELDSRFVIRDLESLNGVYVNGRKCRSTVLSNGDLIELGDVTLKFTVFAAHDRPDLPGAAESTVTPFRSTGKKGPRPV